MRKKPTTDSRHFPRSAARGVEPAARFTRRAAPMSLQRARNDTREAAAGEAREQAPRVLARYPFFGLRGGAEEALFAKLAGRSQPFDGDAQ